MLFLVTKPQVLLSLSKKFHFEIPKAYQIVPGYPAQFTVTLSTSIFFATLKNPHTEKSQQTKEKFALFL